MRGPGRNRILAVIGRAAGLALRAAVTLAAIGLGAVLVLAPVDNGASHATDTAVASTNGATHAGPAATRGPLRTAAASPTASPPGPSATATEPAEPPPGAVSAGGDEPLGAPAVYLAGNMPENPGASPEFLALRDSLAAEIAEYSADVGGVDAAVAVTDIQTGETISVNGNMVHRTGCTINLFALLAAVSEFQAGNADPADFAYSIRKGIGGSYPPEVRNFLTGVFGSYSAGMDRARQLMGAWGMQTSHFYHIPYYGDGVNVNRLTVLEANMVLAKLYRGELFDPEWTAYTLRKLRDVNWGLNYMIPGRLPYTATVAHKIGYYADLDGWVNNDAGVVTFTGADGATKAYAITYLSQQAPTEVDGYALAAILSRLAWNHLAPKYGAAVWPAPPPDEGQPPAEPTPAPPAPTATATPAPTRTPRVITPAPTTPRPGTPVPTVISTIVPAPTPVPVPTPTPGY
ncbi:MAG: serine hydrolase [Dehalococcoidia bacterium]|nr:serine hydrolase [Dehalococcoidia bacterium]